MMSDNRESRGVDKPILHVVFGHSAAGTLRQALAKIRSPDQVVPLPDSLSFGPIDAPCWPDARGTGISEMLGISNWAEVVAESVPFLAASCSPSVHPIAWMTRRSAIDYAGFLWWLFELDDRPCSLIDLTSMTVPHGTTGEPCLISGTGILNADQMIGFLDRSVPLDEDDRQRYQSRWKTLVSENAPLRLIEKGELISAPIDYFDSLLLRLARPEWQKMALIIGQALVEFSDSDMHQTGDLLLHSRLCDLAEQGLLEWQGNLSVMRDCELRLPAHA